MVAGLFTMGLGAFLFIPAARAASYPLFLTALMILAAGHYRALQVAANPYVAVLGPAETASSRLNLAQAFNSLGTTIGPYLGGALILTAVPLSMESVRQLSPEALQAYRIHEASSVKPAPTVVIGLTLFVLGIAIALFKTPGHATGGTSWNGSARKSVWKHRNLVLGTVGIFVYVGAEVAIGKFSDQLSQPAEHWKCFCPGCR